MSTPRTQLTVSIQMAKSGLHKVLRYTRNTVYNKHLCARAGVNTYLAHEMTTTQSGTQNTQDKNTVQHTDSKAIPCIPAATQYTQHDTRL